MAANLASNPTPSSNESELPPRWVVAEVGEAPLEERAISWSADLAGLDPLVEQLRATGIGFELVEVSGSAAAGFPVDGDRPRYWESLNPTHRYLGSLSAHVEVYLLSGTLYVVDDSGPGSPELLGTLDAQLGPRPPDPDDAGVAEDDPAWMAMSDRDLEWLGAVESSPLAAALSSMATDAGWALIEELRSGGFDPHGEERLVLWVANRAGALISPPEPGHAELVEVSNSELGASHTLVGEADGRCAVLSNAKPSAFGEGLVSVKTEHGMLLLDADGTSLVEP